VTLLTESAGVLSNDPEYVLWNTCGKDTLQNDFRWADRISAFFLWGQAQKEILEQKVPDIAKRCHVIGQPRMDSHCLSSGRKKDNSGKKKIGYIGKFSSIIPFDGADMLEVVHSMAASCQRFFLRDEYEMEDILYTQALDLRILFQFAAKLGEDVELHVRSHPRENYRSWEKLLKEKDVPIVFSPWDQPFAHWASEMDFVVGPPSTSFYDCLACGKYPICLRDMDERRERHTIPWLDAGNELNSLLLMPKSMDELIEIVNGDSETHNRAIPQRALDILQAEANFPESQNALTKFAEIALKLMEENPTGVSIFQKNLAKRKFSFYKWKYNSRFLRRIKKGRVQETSNYFLLDKKRVDWINALASN